METRGVEPLSEGPLPSVSPSAAADLDLALPDRQQQRSGLTSPNCATQGQGTPLRRSPLDDVTIRFVGLPVATSSYIKLLKRNYRLLLSLVVPFFNVYPKQKTRLASENSKPPSRPVRPLTVSAVPAALFVCGDRHHAWRWFPVYHTGLCPGPLPVRF